MMKKHCIGLRHHSKRKETGSTNYLHWIKIYKASFLIRFFTHCQALVSIRQNKNDAYEGQILSNFV